MPSTGKDEAEDAEGTVLLPQLVLISPITEQEISPGPTEANGKSLALALQIYFSHYRVLLAFQKMEIAFSDILMSHQHAIVTCYF